MKTFSKSLIAFIMAALFALSSLACSKGELTKLSAPKNLEIVGSLLKWDVVENAKEYIVDFDGESFETPTSSCSLSVFTEPESYIIKVMAKGDKNKFINSDFSEAIEYRVDEITSFSKIYKDFSDGNITTDTYIQQLLFAQYDASSLDAKYKSDEKELTSLPLADEIAMYADELSEDTLRYYYDKLNLDGITFDNEQGTAERMLLKAATPVENLNKAVLSSNKNFVVWYSDDITSGNAITKGTALKIAAGLEKTINFYESYFSTDYLLNSSLIGKGSIYKQMQKTLSNSINNIDEKYLEEAMQVYVVDYEFDGAACYVNPTTIANGPIENALVNIFKFFAQNDARGSVVYPYVLIKPSYTKELDTLEQIYNHEIFHHFQTFLGGGEKKNRFSLINEATANWASALASSPDITDSIMNDHARYIRLYPNSLFGYFSTRLDENSLGYYFFPYLYAYEKHVSGGTQKIVASLYADDPLKYLQENATESELENTMNYLALKTLSQDYENKNLTAKSGYNLRNENATNGIERGYSALYRMGADYYLISENDKIPYQIAYKAFGTIEYLNILIIKEKNNIYTLEKVMSLNQTENVLSTGNFSDYDRLYAVVTNAVLSDSLYKNHYYYSIQVERGEEDVSPEVPDAEVYAYGNGKQDSPYVILTASQLVYFANAVNGGERYERTYFVLGANIDLGGIEWTPIGDGFYYYGYTTFSGYFDGRNYKISNFKITQSTYLFYGLFGYCNGDLNNINIENFTIDISPSIEIGEMLYVGGLAGEYNSYSIGSNNSAQGVISISAADKNPATFHTGGLFGKSNSLSKCYADVDINISYSAVSEWKSLIFCTGGLLGISFNSIIKDCYASGNIVMDVSIQNLSTAVLHTESGGLIGSIYSCTIQNCFAAGNIEVVSETNRNGTIDYAGGLVGDCVTMITDAYNYLINCFSVGNVSATAINPYSSVTMTNPRVGGLYAEDLSLDETAQLSSDTMVNNCYRYSGQEFLRRLNSTINTTPTGTAGAECTASQLNSPSFYIGTLGWSDDIWNFDNLNFLSGSYPTLK